MCSWSRITILTDRVGLSRFEIDNRAESTVTGGRILADPKSHLWSVIIVFLNSRGTSLGALRYERLRDIRIGFISSFVYRKKLLMIFSIATVIRPPFPSSCIIHVS